MLFSEGKEPVCHLDRQKQFLQPIADFIAGINGLRYFTAFLMIVRVIITKQLFSANGDFRGIFQES